MKAQLNKGYFDNLKGANAVQIARINALNNIISNYLANQRNEKLKEIEQQNNVLLLAQAANLVK